jgi:hypothetical protein
VRPSGVDCFIHACTADVTRLAFDSTIKHAPAIVFNLAISSSRNSSNWNVANRLRYPVGGCFFPEMIARKFRHNQQIFSVLFDYVRSLVIDRKLLNR